MDTSPKYISLYSGAGGLDLGFRLANPDARCVAYVERDAEACGLLVDHMQTGRLDDAPVWSDSSTFDGRPYRGKVDFIIGGFPCQPWSAAGKQAGTDDPRWLWPHIQRIASDVGPRGLFLENVAGLLYGGIEHVLGGLAELGFDAEWTSIRASEVGASHRRERVFILAYRNDEQGHIQQWATRPELDTGSDELADSCCERPQGRLLRRVAGEERREAQDGRPASDSREVVAAPCRGREPAAMDSPGEHRDAGWFRNGAHASDAFPPGPEESRWSETVDARPDLSPALSRGDELSIALGLGLAPQPTHPRAQAEYGLVLGKIISQATPESAVYRMVNGMARGLARTAQIRLTGNGVVPQQAAAAYRELASRVS